MKDWGKFQNKSTLELIELFQDKSQSEIIRDSAFYAISHKFQEDLLEKCEIICKNFGHNVTIAEQIAESTFINYAKKGCFQLEKANHENIDKSFKLYLYGIAKRELVNYYRLEEKKRLGVYYDGTEKIVTDLPDHQMENLSIEIKVKLKAIKSLPKSHRTVYLTYMKYEKLGCNLPRKLQKELREYLGVKQNTIRTYKKEALDKIEDYLEIMKFTQSQE